MVSNDVEAGLPPALKGGIMSRIWHSVCVAALVALAVAPPQPCVAAKDWRAVKPVYNKFECTGEVVDSWCYASKSVGEGRGPEHARCANACAHGGVTLGIVDDQGKLYIAAKYKAYSGCQQLLEPYVAKRVHITGFLATTGGCNILKINTVEEVGADNKPLHPKPPAGAKPAR